MQFADSRAAPRTALRWHGVGAVVAAVLFNVVTSGCHGNGSGGSATRAGPRGDICQAGGATLSAATNACVCASGQSWDGTHCETSGGAPAAVPELGTKTLVPEGASEDVEVAARARAAAAARAAAGESAMRGAPSDAAPPAVAGSATPLPAAAQDAEKGDAPGAAALAAARNDAPQLAAQSAALRAARDVASGPGADSAPGAAALAAATTNASDAALAVGAASAVDAGEENPAAKSAESGADSPALNADDDEAAARASARAAAKAAALEAAKQPAPRSGTAHKQKIVKSILTITQAPAADADASAPGGSGPVSGSGPVVEEAANPAAATNAGTTPAAAAPAGASTAAPASGPANATTAAPGGPLTAPVNAPVPTKDETAAATKFASQLQTACQAVRGEWHATPAYCVCPEAKVLVGNRCMRLPGRVTDDVCLRATHKGRWRQGDCECPGELIFSPSRGGCVAPLLGTSPAEDQAINLALQSGCESSLNRGTWDSQRARCVCPAGRLWVGELCVSQTDMSSAEVCTSSFNKGQWDAPRKRCSCPAPLLWINQSCQAVADLPLQTVCESEWNHGKWFTAFQRCSCPKHRVWDAKQRLCIGKAKK